MAVTSAEPFANHLHLAPDGDNQAGISQLSFYGPGALPDVQPTVSRIIEQ